MKGRKPEIHALPGALDKAPPAPVVAEVRQDRVGTRAACRGKDWRTRNVDSLSDAQIFRLWQG